MTTLLLLSVAGLLMWGAVPYERTCLSFTIAAGFASAVIFGSQSRRTRDHTRILLFQTRDFPSRRLLRHAGLQWRYSIFIYRLQTVLFYHFCPTI
jgi:hypothetical protein